MVGRRRQRVGVPNDLSLGRCEDKNDEEDQRFFLGVRRG
jgi:hypothetical protein